MAAVTASNAIGMKPISELDNKEVLIKLEKGDEAIFKAIYDEYRDVFIQWASNQFEEDQEALLDTFQEAIAELFLKVKKGQYDPEKSSIKTYLFSIGKNHICETRRKNYSQASFQCFDESLECFHTDGLADSTHTAETSQAVETLLNQVGYNQRKVMELFYLEGCSLQQIANRLGYSNSQAVKTIKHRTIRYLKKHLSI